MSIYNKLVGLVPSLCLLGGATEHGEKEAGRGKKTGWEKAVTIATEPRGGLIDGAHVWALGCSELERLSRISPQLPGPSRVPPSPMIANTTFRRCRAIPLITILSAWRPPWFQLFDRESLCSSPSNLKFDHPLKPLTQTGHFWWFFFFLSERTLAS